MRMTLYGMLQYDSTLFDGVVLPEGYNANDLKDTIVERCGDLYPYYQVPERVKLAIQRFFLENYNNFDMMYKALHNEYNPIENTDWSEASTRNIENTDNGQDNRVIEGGTTVNNSTTTNLTNTPGSYSETTNYTNAYNEGTGTERDRAKTVQGGTDSTNTTTTDNGTTANSSSDVLNYEKTNNTEDKYSVRRHGNIGVQTTAQIITMELEMRQNNVYEIICDLFEKRICVQVY